MCLIKSVERTVQNIDYETGELTTERIFKIERQNIYKVSDKELKIILQNSNLKHVANYLNRLGLNQTVYAVHSSGEYSQQQALMTRYSMHSMCPLWSWRKSRIIRRKYVNFFRENRDYMKDYTPCHLVITLRHNENGYFINDTFYNKRFYARELISQFQAMRKDWSYSDRLGTDFKKLFEGGTYNIEIKLSKENGLHIHMHCLVLVPNGKFEEARSFIKYAWQQRTGATQVVLDKLYYMDYSQKGNPKKVEHAPDWTDENLAFAIMEALKYTFKGDEFLKQDGKLCLESLEEVLENSKNLRFYSRFGSLYNVKALSFNFDEPNGYAEDLASLKDFENDLLDSVQLSERISQISNDNGISEEQVFQNWLESKKIKDFSQKDANFINRYLEVVNPATGKPDRDFKLYIGLAANQHIRQGAPIANHKHLFKVHEKYNRLEMLGELFKSFYTSDGEGLLVRKDRKRFYFYLKKVKERPPKPQSLFENLSKL